MRRPRPADPLRGWALGEKANLARNHHSRKWECNSVCARGLLLKSLSSLLYILSGEPIIEKVFSYWIYFLARLPTTSGPVGWGLCGCDAACTLAPADAWSAPRHSPGRQITNTFTVTARWRKPIGSLRSAMERCHVLRVFVGIGSVLLRHRRRLNGRRHRRLHSSRTAF